MKTICAHYGLVVVLILDAARCSSIDWDPTGTNEVDSINEKLMKCCRITKFDQRREGNGNDFHTMRIVVDGAAIYGYGKEYASSKNERNLRAKQTSRSNKQLMFYPRVKPAPSRTYTPYKPWNLPNSWHLSRPPFPLWEPLPGRLPSGPPKPSLAGISRKFRRNLRLSPSRRGNYGFGRSEGSIASPSNNLEANDVSQNQQDAMHSASLVSLRNFENHRTSPSDIITGIVDRDNISTLVSSSILVRGH